MSDHTKDLFSHYLYREEECRVVSRPDDDGQMATYLVFREDGDAIAKFTGTLTEQQVFEALLLANAAYAEAYAKGHLDGRFERGGELMAASSAMKDKILEETRRDMLEKRNPSS